MRTLIQSLTQLLRKLFGVQPAPGTPIHVHVCATGGTKGVNFSHDWNFAGGPKQGFGRIEVPRRKKHQLGTPIHFHLINNTHPRVELEFVNDQNAIWVDRTGCPLNGPKSDREITNINPLKQHLVVQNRNEENCLLYYTLRFKPDPDLYCYDPEIKNGGITN